MAWGRALAALTVLAAGAGAHAGENPAAPDNRGSQRAAQGEGFIDDLRRIDRSRWYVSDFTQADDDWIDTAWSAELARGGPDGAALTLLTERKHAKTTIGAEIQTRGVQHYGRYEAVLRAARGGGMATAFFTYTGPYFKDPHDEIDFEFLGKDTTKVQTGIFTDGAKSPLEWTDLGFDAAETEALYAFEWRPDSVRWYVNDRLIREITAADHPIPSTPGKIFLNVWAGSRDLEGWLGRRDLEDRQTALISCVSFRPMGDVGDQCSDRR